MLVSVSALFRGRWIVAAASLSALAISGGAGAANIDLGTAGQYNIYVVHNDTQAGSDVGSSGPNSPLGVAVGNNFQTTAATVNGNVVVGGNFTNSSNTVTGNVLANSVDWNTPSLSGTISSVTSVSLGNGGGSVQGGVFYETTYAGPSYISHTQIASGSITYPFNFSTVSADVTNLSAELHVQPSTPGSSVTGGNNNQLLLSGSGSNFYLFHVTSTQLAGMNDFLIHVSGLNGMTPTVVVDVTDLNGDSGILHSNSLSLNGTDSNHVLFNFSQATSLDTNHDGINGSLLAPMQT